MLRSRLCNNVPSGILRRELFAALDTDSSGGIDAVELADGLAARGYSISRDEVRGWPGWLRHIYSGVVLYLRAPPRRAM